MSYIQFRLIVLFNILFRISTITVFYSVSTHVQVLGEQQILVTNVPFLSPKFS